MKRLRLFHTIFGHHLKIFLLLTIPLVFIGIGIGVYTQKNRVILPEFLEYEKKMAINQMRMVFQAIEKQIQDLEMICHQWLKQKAVQTAFIEQKGFQHLSQSIDSDTLETLFHIPLIQLIASDGGILFTKGTQKNDLTNQAFKTFRNSILSGNKAFLSKTKHAYWHIIPSSSKPIIVCGTEYISPQDQTQMGYFFLGYPLDLNDLISRKALEDLDIQIQMLATPEKVLDYFPKENNPDDSTPPYQFNVLENNLLMTQMFFHDSNTPLLNIKINIRRDLNVPINKITRITALTIIAVAICMWIYLAAAFLINQNMLNTKNQDMELKLDQTRDWFFKIFKSKTVFVVITRLDTGEIVEVNTELIEALNYTQDEIIGKTITELGVYKNEEERKAVTKTIQDKGYGRDLYLQLPTKDNRIVHVSVSSDLIDYKGNACILNVLIDVTQRKKLETDLKKAKLDASQATANTEIKNHQLAVEVNQRNQVEKTNQALFDISNAVNTTRDLDELYAHIHRILGTIMKLDNFYIASYNKEEDRVTFPYWHDEKNISSEDIDNISKRISLTVEVIKSGKPLIAYKKDFEPGGRFFEWGFSDTAAKNWLGIPLKIKKDVIGVMVTQNYSGQEEYTDKDINLMGTVSDQVALAIERKSAQDALLQSEIKYRSIIEEVQDGYCETDIYGRITFFNKSLCRISGYKEKELSGKNFSDLIQGTKKLNEVLQTDPDSNETRIKLKQKDGALKHMGIRPAPVIDVNGEQKGYRTFVHDIDEQKKHEEKLVFLAYHDSLTGLHNRKAFYEYLTGILNQAKRDPNNVALVFMDIDKFKKVNDTLSHEKGDALLKEIASRLTEILRKTDYISRIGGDEFTVVMTGKSAFNPIELAEKILEAIRLPYHLGRDAVDYVSTSIGVSIYPDDSAEDAEDLVHQADQAMYEAKKTGDTFVFYKDI